MISWKHSFNKLNDEYEMAKKKMQALDNLLNSGKISQPTHEQISKEMEEAIIEIERQQEALLEKMNSRIAELEGQIKMLEVLLANSEIRHVTGEVNDEAYQRESSMLSTGLDAARQEIGSIKEAVNQLLGNVQSPASDVGIEQKVESVEQAAPVVEIGKDSPQASQEQK